MNARQDRNPQAWPFSLPLMCQPWVLYCPQCGVQIRLWESRRRKRVRLAVQQIMEERGWDEDRLREELKRRQEVLEWMRINKIRHFRDVSQMLISYFRDPEAVIQKIRSELYE